MKKWKLVLLSTLLTGACALGMNGCANAKARMPENDPVPYTQEQTTPSADTDAPETTPEHPDCPDGKDCPHRKHGHKHAPDGKGMPHRKHTPDGHRPTPLPAPAPDGTEQNAPRTDKGNDR